MWYQKSRENWVKFCNHSTRFFHTQTSVRWKQNKIHGMFLEDGNWCIEPDMLKEGAQGFFIKLFSIDVQISKNHIMDNRPPTLTIGDRLELVR